MRALLVSIAILAITVGTGATARADTVRFSIAPARASEGGAFFSYTLGPGVAVGDTAVVQNSSATPIVLRLYAADAVTATNGGTAFMGQGQFRDHTHAWLALQPGTITVPASGSLAIPFRVVVPKEATAGDHIAGLVVETAPQQPGAGGSFAAAIVQRAGVAVVIHIPGLTSSRLALGEVCLNQQNGSNYLQLVAANQGDVLTKASGDLVLKAEAGADVFRRKIDVGTVLPHDSAFVRVDAPLDPGAGRFVAQIRLTLTDGTTASLDAPIAIAETKANGCAAADAAPAPQAPTRTTAQVAAPQRSDAPGSVGALSGAVLALVAAAAGILVGAAGIWMVRRP